MDKIAEYKYFVCPICKRRDIAGRLDQKCREESGLVRFMGSPLPYSNELVKKIIYAFKYRRAREIANPLSKILIEFLDKNGFSEYIEKRKLKTLIIPVPLYDFRERERGFNQAAELAKIISANYGLPFSDKAIIRKKNTLPQADIKTREERAKNISGAFSCENPEITQNKIAILVDDVYTSGNTMRECALVLKNAGLPDRQAGLHDRQTGLHDRQTGLPAGQAGAAEVWGMTVARG
ncbi:MAG: phosphoribosyltransferase family protein [Candidatus Spechtbacterales bacterium]